MLTGYISSVGLIGPGIDNWEQFCGLSENFNRYNRRPINVPTPGIMPRALQRRTSSHMKLAVAVADQVFNNASMGFYQCPAVFASSENDGFNTDEICDTITVGDRMVSPTKFHHSVNNAAVGVWSIVTELRQATSSIICYEGPFAAGLLESVAISSSQRSPVLLVVHDTKPPARLQKLRPFIDSFAAAFLITGKADEDSKYTMTMELCNNAEDSVIESTDLEKLRKGNPAATCLPALMAIAKGENAQIVVPYIDDLKMQLTLSLL